MGLFLSAGCRQGVAQAIITQAGAGAKLELWDGIKPAAGGATGGGNTKRATVTFGATIGTATGAGVLDFDEAGATQVNSTHVSGAATFARITTSGGAVVADIDIGAGAGNWQLSSNVVNGQNVALTSLSFTAGNAS